MLMTILLFASGLWLSSISAIYAIIGLLSIFPAAPYTIILMGSAFEVSKLVIASWLYRNWREIPIILKTWFSVAVLVLMFLTSMSVFGMLSKAHLDSGLISSESVASLSIVDEKIATQRENISQAKKALTQMDTQVNEMLTRTTDEKGTDKAIRARAMQKKERASLNAEITAAQSEISKLQNERAPLASSVRKVEAEVGPIKYIANLIYGDKIDESILEKAVRGVILMIVFVFDPLAVLLLIAANWNLKHREKLKTIVTKRHLETVEDTIEKSIEVIEPEINKPVACEIKLDDTPKPIITSETGNEETIEHSVLHNEETKTETITEPTTEITPVVGVDANQSISVISEVKVDDYTVIRAPGADSGNNNE